MAILKSIQDNSVTLASGANVTFEFPVASAMEFDGVVVVLLQIPRGKIFNENVYGVDPDGHIMWQIQPEYPTNWDGAWGGLENRGGHAVLSNTESKLLYVDPKTGTVIRRGMSMY